MTDTNTFWMERAARLDWMTAPTKAGEVDYGSGSGSDVSIKWFADGVLNVSANCLDRHVTAGKGDQVAIIWEGDDPTKDAKITYAEALEAVAKFANGLKSMGVQKGDRVTLYMPMVVEAAYAMLACARLGAVHSVVFGGFSPDALAGRIQDCESQWVITADQGLRGGKAIPLKANVDKALESCPDVKGVVVVEVTGTGANLKAGRDQAYAAWLPINRRLPARAHAG